MLILSKGYKCTDCLDRKCSKSDVSKVQVKNCCSGNRYSLSEGEVLPCGETVAKFLQQCASPSFYQVFAERWSLPETWTPKQMEFFLVQEAIPYLTNKLSCDETCIAFSQCKDMEKRGLGEDIDCASLIFGMLADKTIFLGDGFKGGEETQWKKQQEPW